MYLARAASLTPASKDPLSLSLSLSFGGPFSFSHFSIWSLFRPCPPWSVLWDVWYFCQTLDFQTAPILVDLFFTQQRSAWDFNKAVAVQCYQSGWRYCCSYRSEALLTKSSPPWVQWKNTFLINFIIKAKRFFYFSLSFPPQFLVGRCSGGKWGAKYYGWISADHRIFTFQKMLTFQLFFSIQEFWTTTRGLRNSP